MARVCKRVPKSNGYETDLLYIYYSSMSISSSGRTGVNAMRCVDVLLAPDGALEPSTGCSGSSEAGLSP